MRIYLEPTAHWLKSISLTLGTYICIEQNVIQISELFLNSTTKDLLFSIILNLFFPHQFLQRSRGEVSRMLS